MLVNFIIFAKSILKIQWSLITKSQFLELWQYNFYTSDNIISTFEALQKLFYPFFQSDGPAALCNSRLNLSLHPRTKNLYAKIFSKTWTWIWWLLQWVKKDCDEYSFNLKWFFVASWLQWHPNNFLIGCSFLIFILIVRFIVSNANFVFLTS